MYVNFVCCWGATPGWKTMRMICITPWWLVRRGSRNSNDYWLRQFDNSFSSFCTILVTTAFFASKGMWVMPVFTTMWQWFGSSLPHGQCTGLVIWASILKDCVRFLLIPPIWVLDQPRLQASIFLLSVLFLQRLLLSFLCFSFYFYSLRVTLFAKLRIWDVLARRAA